MFQDCHVDYRLLAMTNILSQKKQILFPFEKRERIHMLSSNVILNSVIEATIEYSIIKKIKSEVNDCYRYSACLSSSLKFFGEN